MFKIKNDHSPNYLADLFKFPPRKGLRSFIYSHFLGCHLIVLMPNLHFPTVAPFYGTLSPNLTTVTSLLSFRKDFKTVV